MGKSNSAIRVHEFSRNLRLRSWMVRCSLAALSTIPALGIWLAALPWSRQVSYLPFFFSVLFSAWFLGHGPGLTATVVSVLLVELFIFPLSSLESGNQIFLHLAFVGAGIAMSVMAAAKSTAEQKLEHLTSTLEARAEERIGLLERQIQQQKETEALLSRRAMLVQLTHDAIIVKGYDDARIEFWNRGATELYGWLEEEALGKNLPDLLKPEYSESPAAMEEKLLRSGRWDGVTIHTRNDGQQVTVASRWSLIRDAGGRPKSVIQLHADVTEKYEAEQKARDNERLATLGTAAAVFAHEVANPLNGIASSLQMLELELVETRALSPSLAETLRVSMEEIQRLARLLNDFRTLSRPRSLALTDTSVRDVIEEVLSAEEAALSAAGIKVQRECQCAQTVLADQEKIKQVFLNLIKNAAEAMPEGGILVIRCYTVTNSLRVEITDTGGGMPEDVDVFQLFTTTKPDGTGMGLPVVREILIAHRAQITFSSQPGKGTTFTIDFPLGGANEPPAGQE